jgi:large repetitive protein
VDSFTFRASDGVLASNTATVSITVTPVNDPPVAIAKSVVTEEGAPVSIALTATDKDSTSLTFTVVSGPTKGALSGSAPNLTYTPAPGFNGSDSFTFRASDGSAVSNTATVSITVTAVNEPPVAAAGSATTAEDASVAIKLSASDPDGDALSYVIVTAPSKGKLSGTAPNLTYTPAADFHGVDSFTFRASDGVLASNTATVSITVTPVNDPPVAIAKSVVTEEGAPVSIALTATDKDSTSLTFTVVSGPTKGALSGSVPNLTYTPAPGFNGSDSFTFRATDGSAVSNTATVSITVTAVNEPPVAAAGSATTAEDTSVAITLSASDPDGDALSYVIVTAPSKGKLGGTAPNLTYTPAADFHGVDSFTFRASDGVLASNTATVSITVTSVNDPPVAIAGSAATEQDIPVSILLSATDKDSASLSFTIVSGPANGALSGTAPNITYTPAPGFIGSDSFGFRANDGKAASNTAVVSITVNPTPPPPNIAPSFETSRLAMSATEGKEFGGQLHATDPDETGSLVFTKLFGPSWLSVSTSGALSGKPSLQDLGANSFVVRVTDSAKASAWVVLAITVTSSNKAPVFLVDPIIGASGSEESAYEGGSIAGTAEDPDAGDTITFMKIAGPDWLIVSGTGDLSGTPPAGSAGSQGFTVRATDMAGASADASLQIEIAPRDLPLPWELEDLGKTGLVNRAVFDSGTFTLEGSGSLGGSSDSGCYVWRTLGGDGEIIARVSFSDVSQASMAGLMIRDSLAPNSRQVFMGADGRGEIRWLRRSATGGSTKTSTTKIRRSSELWLWLERRGGTVSAYASINGSYYFRVGSMTMDIGTNCYIGLAVASGSDATSTAGFSEVSIRP